MGCDASEASPKPRADGSSSRGTSGVSPKSSRALEKRVDSSTSGTPSFHHPALPPPFFSKKQSAVDNNRRYVSPRVRRKPFARASVGIFPGQIFQKEVSLPTLLTYRRFMSTKGVFREEGVAFTCLSPIKKAKQTHTSFPPAPSARSFVRALVPACSYIPAPVPHPRVFGLPPAHNPRLRFFVLPQRSLRALAFSVRPDPVRRMVPSVRPSARPFTMPQPRFALSRFRLP